MVDARARQRIRVAVLFVAAAACTSANAASWGDVETASPGPTRIIGRAANGCIAGAVRLPDEGRGFEAIRISRNRDFGHPDTVAFVETLGQEAAAAGLAPFYVGDMSQPRGGPMVFGHAAHQNGLDVDIWFNLDPKPPLAASERENIDLPSMVLASQAAINPARFGKRQVRLLRLAATDPRVDRIFVHWTIKRALCDGYGGAGEGDRSWLHRIRPWYGHDDHFHVRLTCPTGSPDCQGQPAVPSGLGCDGTLDWWFHHEHPSEKQAPLGSWRLGQRMPRQCQALLALP